MYQTRVFNIFAVGMLILSSLRIQAGEKLELLEKPTREQLSSSQSTVEIHKLDVVRSDMEKLSEAGKLDGLKSNSEGLINTLSDLRKLDIKGQLVEIEKRQKDSFQYPKVGKVIDNHPKCIALMELLSDLGFDDSGTCHSSKV